jgi:hypothetical protein
MSQDTDIDLMLADCGDTFTAAGVTQPCLLTMHDEVVGGDTTYPGQVVGMGHALVRTSAFPDLATNDLVTVKAEGAANAVEYRAAQLGRIQDGRMMQVFLGAAE